MNNLLTKNLTYESGVSIKYETTYVDTFQMYFSFTKKIYTFKFCKMLEIYVPCADDSSKKLLDSNDNLHFNSVILFIKICAKIR